MCFVKSRSKTYLKSLAVRLATCLALGGLVWTFVGLPIPTGRAKDRSVPFPCQDRACGCMSAADCKHGCCCFSEDERRDWARERGLDPSTLADEPAGSVSLDPAENTGNESSCSSADGCCCKQHAPEQEQVCIDDKEEDSDVVLAWQARRCHGEGSSWLTVAFIMPPSPITYSFPFDQSSFLTDASPLSPPVRTDRPDEPVAWL